MRPFALSIAAMFALALCSTEAHAGFRFLFEVTDGTDIRSTNADSPSLLEFPDGTLFSWAPGVYGPHSVTLTSSLVLPSLPAGSNTSYDITVLIVYQAQELGPPEPSGGAPFIASHTYMSAAPVGATGTANSYADGTGDTGSPLAIQPFSQVSPYSFFTPIDPYQAEYTQEIHIHIGPGFGGGSLEVGSVFGTPAPPSLTLVASSLPFAVFFWRYRRSALTPRAV